MIIVAVKQLFYSCDFCPPYSLAYICLCSVGFTVVLPVSLRIKKLQEGGCLTPLILDGNSQVSKSNISHLYLYNEPLLLLCLKFSHMLVKAVNVDIPYQAFFFCLVPPLYRAYINYFCQKCVFKCTHGVVSLIQPHCPYKTG